MPEISTQPDAEDRGDTVALIGAGVVGRGWIPTFSRAGCMVRVYDADRSQLDHAAAWFADYEADNPGGARSGAAHVRFERDLGAALAGASYVQESISEDLSAKASLFGQIAARVSDKTLIASSTSSIDINDIARDVAHPERCFTVHPFNPAAVIPVVEVLGTRLCGALERLRLLEFLRSVGQVPVVLSRFTPGYVGNRLQAAVMREAMDLLGKGVVDTDGIDFLLSQGLALRWVLLGAFGTNHANADEGVRGYYRRFYGSYRALMATLAVDAPELDEVTVERIAAALDARFGAAPVAQIARWRDQCILELRRTLEGHPFKP